MLVAELATMLVVDNGLGTGRRGDLDMQRVCVSDIIG